MTNTKMDTTSNYYKKFIGGNGEIRTHNLRFKRPLL